MSRPTAKWQRGTSAIEFAIILPMLVFLVCMIIDLGMIFWVNLTMQYAVHEGARYAVTGQTNLDPGKTPTRSVAVVEAIRDSSMGLYDTVAAPPVVIVNGKSNAANAGSYGGPGDLIVIQINCTWPLLTPLMKPFFTNGTYKFTVAATMRNEGFQ